MIRQDRMIRTYDRMMARRDYQRYFDDSGFYNFGYWSERSTSQREASEDLVDRLIDRIPNKEGRILDVACGPGGTTRRLLRSYAHDKITGINVSAAQIAEARKRAPGCAFHVMDATRLGFSEAQFDAVICVEAAFHFNTRDTFFRESLRVLKPGGTLVLSDMLFRGVFRPFAELGHVPRANLAASLAEFRSRLEAAGFEEIDVRDATQACVGGFRRHVKSWPASERRGGRMGLAKSLAASFIGWATSVYLRVVCRTYILASARKPLSRRDAES